MSGLCGVDEADFLGFVDRLLDEGFEGDRMPQRHQGFSDFFTSPDTRARWAAGALQIRMHQWANEDGPLIAREYYWSMLVNGTIPGPQKVERATKKAIAHRTVEARGPAVIAAGLGIFRVPPATKRGRPRKEGT
jgi:hypothetical protein